MHEIFDAYGPQDEPVKAKLKWFNGPKGFGFVVPEGETIDAFLHITTLQRAGLTTLGEGADVVCCIKRGQKGAMVTEVVEVINHGILAVHPKSGSLVPSPDAPPGVHTDATAMTGIIKWYKPDKGFGFIIPEDQGKDVFVHKACLDALGLSTLEPGQSVRMRVRTVSKGREALDIQLIS